MKLDSASLKATVNEISRLVTGGFLQKISQLNRYDLVLLIRQPGQTYKLLVKLAPDDTAFYLTEENLPPAQIPTAFLMMLRKYIQGKKLEQISQPGIERQVTLHFGEWQLILELPGKRNNVYLVSMKSRVRAKSPSKRGNTPEKPAPLGKVAGVMFRGNLGQERELKPGDPFVPMPRDSRPDPTLLSEEDLETALIHYASEAGLPVDDNNNRIASPPTPLTPKRLLNNTFFGLPPHHINYICSLAGVKANQELGQASPAETSELLSDLSASLYAWCQRLLHGPYQPVLSSDGRLSPWPLDEAQPAVSVNITSLPAASSKAAALPQTASSQEQEQAQMQVVFDSQSSLPGLEKLRHELLKLVNKAHSKAQRVLDNRLRDLEKSSQAPRWKTQGELLLRHLPAAEAALAQAQEGLTVELTLPSSGEDDGLTDNDPPITLTLDRQKSATANAQEFFAKYKRLTRAVAALQEPLAQARERLDFIEEVRRNLEQASSLQELDELQELWNEAMPSQNQGPKAVRQAPKLGPKRYMFGTYQILVGRNPKQNEQLSTKIAAPQDIWFHVRGASGSHVILRTAGRAPEAEAIQAAATLAALHSTASQNNRVEVTFTLAKYVHKIKGGLPGRVTYKGDSTIAVDPNAHISELRCLDN